MNEKTALDELQFIRKIIEESKTTVIDNGKGYIFWGLIVAVGLLLNYFGLMFKWGLSSLTLWLVIIGLGWTYSFYTYFTKKSERKVITFGSKVLSGIWISVGIGMTITGFVATTAGAIKGIYVSPMICTILGIAYFISSYFHNEKWMRWLSIGWWVGAVFMFYYPSIHSIFIMASMMTFFQIVPGLYLYRKYKKEMVKR